MPPDLIRGWVTGFASRKPCQNKKRVSPVLIQSEPIKASTPKRPRASFWRPHPGVCQIRAKAVNRHGRRASTGARQKNVAGKLPDTTSQRIDARRRVEGFR